MGLRVWIFFVLAAFGIAGCTSPSGSRAVESAAPPRDFGEVTLQAFERHPNLRKAPEGRVQDSMFGCALAWRSDHTTPEAERLINAAKAYDLMAEGNWKEIDLYCRLSELKKYLP